MVRRKLTLKRVDPWSVLKFGFVLNIALLIVLMIGFWVIWTVIGRLGLVDSFCDSVGEVFLDLDDCGINSGPLFRTVLLVGALGVVVQTGIMVFGAFLYNLIADLTGGLAFSFLDESGDATLTSARRAETSAAGDGASPSGTGRASTRSTPAPYLPDDRPPTPPAPSPSRPEHSTPSASGTTSATSTPQRTEAPPTPRSAQPERDDATERQASRQSLWGDRD